MVQDPLLIGLDFGSDSVRALVVDKQGCTLATAVDNYRRWSQQLYCNAAIHQFRQHPLDHLERYPVRTPTDLSSSPIFMPLSFAQNWTFFTNNEASCIGRLQRF